MHGSAAVREKDAALQKEKLLPVCSFPKITRTKPESCCNNATTFGLNEKLHVWTKEDGTFQNLIPSVLAVISISIVLWARRSPSGPGRLSVIGEAMNSEFHQPFLKESVRTFVCELNLKRK